MGRREKTVISHGAVGLLSPSPGVITRTGFLAAGNIQAPAFNGSATSPWCRCPLPTEAAEELEERERGQARGRARLTPATGAGDRDALGERAERPPGACAARGAEPQPPAGGRGDPRLQGSSPEGERVTQGQGKGVRHEHKQRPEESELLVLPLEQNWLKFLQYFRVPAY